jgi:LPXTG-motif cell wall-anchored protein
MVAMTAVLAVVPSARAQTAAPAGSVGIRILDAPTNRADDPRARLYIVDHLAPGATINRRVELSNGTDGRLTIPLYAAAATVSDGEFRFGEDHAANDLTSWTTVEPSTIAVDGGGTAIATVKIAVPADAGAGERYAVVWAELPAASPKGGGISTVNRVGIRIYLSVGAGGEPPSDFTITSIQARRGSSGEPVVAATVKNTGGRALDLSGELRLSRGPGGLSAGPFPAKLGTTLGIGATEPVLVILDRAVPAGPWDAHIALKSGTIERDATARITFPKRGASKAAKTGSGKRSLLLLILIVAGVLLLLLLALLLRRRRRSRGG